MCLRVRCIARPLLRENTAVCRCTPALRNSFQCNVKRDLSDRLVHILRNFLESNVSKVNITSAHCDFSGVHVILSASGSQSVADLELAFIRWAGICHILLTAGFTTGKTASFHRRIHRRFHRRVSSQVAPQGCSSGFNRRVSPQVSPQGFIAGFTQVSPPKQAQRSALCKGSLRAFVLPGSSSMAARGRLGSAARLRWLRRLRACLGPEAACR